MIKIQGHYTGAEYYVAQGHEFGKHEEPDAWYAGRMGQVPFSPALDNKRQAETYVEIAEDDIAEEIANTWDREEAEEPNPVDPYGD